VDEKRVRRVGPLPLSSESGALALAMSALRHHFPFLPFPPTTLPKLSHCAYKSSCRLIDRVACNANAIDAYILVLGVCLLNGPSPVRSKGSPNLRRFMTKATA
jgi:hypothetical protein